MDGSHQKYRKIAVDLASDGEARRRVKTLTGNDRVKLEFIEPEKFVGRFGKRFIDDFVSQNFRRRIDS